MRLFTAVRHCRHVGHGSLSMAAWQAARAAIAEMPSAFCCWGWLALHLHTDQDRCQRCRAHPRRRLQYAQVGQHQADVLAVVAAEPAAMKSEDGHIR